MKSYIFGGDTGISYDEAERRRRLADMILMGRQRRPRTVGEGIAYLGDTVGGLIAERRAKVGEDAARQQGQEDFAAIMSGPSARSPVVAVEGGSITGDMGNYADAIASIESAGSGDYSALGPVTGTGDRAYGRYQVMGNNIGPWTREALGQEMTPQQFLADPQAQDRVFQHRFGSYVDQYGNPQDAASMWFTGKPMAQGYGRRDQLGTSGAEYVSKFNRALERPAQAAPAAPQIDQRIISAMDNPYLSEGQRQVLGLMLQRQLEGLIPPSRDERLRTRLLEQQVAEGEAGPSRDDQLRTQLLEQQVQRGQLPPAREIRDDVMKRPRYLDTGELVFPDVELPEGWTGSGVTVNVGEQEKAFAKELGKGLAQRHKAMQEEAGAGQDALISLSEMENAMADPGFYSGFGADQVLELRRLGSALGLDIEGIDSMEAFNSQSKAAALASMGGSLGAGFSDADRSFVTGQVPNLENTPEGNARLIEIQKRINRRKIEMARFATDYAKTHGGQLDVGFDAALREWREANPAFPEAEMQPAPAASAPSAPQTQQKPITGTIDGLPWSYK